MTGTESAVVRGPIPSRPRRITRPARARSRIVRGSASDILSADIAKRMLETLPDGRLVEVAGAGHTVPGDQPDAFARAVRAFIEE